VRDIPFKPARRAGAYVLQWMLPLLALTTACGSGFKPELYASPTDLFDASKAQYQRGKCGAASRGFERVLTELAPRDPRLAEARFLLGECQFQDKAYLDASRTFRRAAEDFPEHELAPTALMRSGDALAKLWRDPELDPTYGEQALSTYSEVLQRYPDASAAAETRKRVSELTDKFAIKNIKTGDFYFRLKAYDAAILYYKLVVAQWSQSTYAPTALMKLVRTYRRIGYEEEATETCAHLRRFYPEAEGLSEVCPAPATP
jgi:outer membrane protein assembly factor BamD